MMHLEELLLPARQMSRQEFSAAYPVPFLLLRLDPKLNPDTWSFKTSTVASHKIDLAKLVESGALVVAPDIDNYRLFPLTKAEGNPWRERVSIGRARNNDVVLPDSSVSKLHAYVTFEDGKGAVIRDAGSRNGTRVGETRLQGNIAQGVAPGDVVTFGALSLTFLDGQRLYDLIHSLLRDRP